MSNEVVDYKSLRLIHRDARQARQQEMLLQIIQNPVLELVGGYLAVDWLRHHGIKEKKSSTSTSTSKTWVAFVPITTTTTIETEEDITTPLLGNQAANWCEVGIFLSVAAQQMKNNPQASAIVQSGIQSSGMVASSGINLLSSVFTGFSSAAKSLLAGLAGA